jgi:hypothetical protein
VKGKTPDALAETTTPPVAAPVSGTVPLASALIATVPVAAPLSGSVPLASALIATVPVAAPLSGSVPLAVPAIGGSATAIRGTLTRSDISDPDQWRAVLERVRGG